MNQYRKGDYVRYGISGVCCIEDIRTDSLAKKDSGEYYVLHPIAERGATIMVPTGSETLTAKMAPLPSREELDALILSARDQDVPWIEDRKERNAQFQQAVKRCDTAELLALVSRIYHKREELESAGKKLTAADEAILRRAEGLIENEMGFVLELEGPQVGEYIREKLDIRS